MVNYSHYKNVLVEKKDGVALVTLNRPQVLNAINPEMHTELEDLWADIARDNEVNAVVVTGAGRAFCSGGDIRGMEQRAFQGGGRRPITGAKRLVHNMLEIEVPVICAANGDAVGLGATIALFCDVVYAVETARFADTHVRVGLVAGDGGAVIWPLLIGPSKAKEYLMTGDFLSAKEAERIGLISKVFPTREDLMTAAMALANRLANGPTLAIRWTKMAVNKQVWDQANLVIEDSLATESISMQSEDHMEAVKAFLEKRQPKYKGI